jgi:putative tricarboxylic transport membrane protein
MLMNLARTCSYGSSALALMLAATPADAAWEPTKTVEIVVAAGAGGASDQMARMMQAAIQKNNLMKQPIVVSLKGGASGAEALMYMKNGSGDPNKVLIAYSLIYMLPLSAKLPFNWRDLTPISVLALDQFVLWNNVTLPQKNVKEFIAAAKGANPPFKMGGTGSKREDQILTVFVEKLTGAKFAYLPYTSGGEAATQLVGNHTASKRQQSLGEPGSLACQPSARALRVRQGAHRLYGQGRGRQVVERCPDLQGGGAGRPILDVASDVPPRQGHG